MNLYKAIVINDTGGLTRGLQRGANVEVNINVQPESLTHLNYQFWYPDTTVYREIDECLEEFDNYDVLGYIYKDTSTLKEDLERIIKVSRPKILILGKLHKQDDKEKQKNLVNYIERKLGYMMWGVTYVKLKDSYKIRKNAFKMETQYYGFPYCDEEYYMVCFDKDRYMDYSEKIRKETPHVKPEMSREIDVLGDIIDLYNTDKELYVRQEKINRLKKTKRYSILELNDEKYAPCLRVPREDDDYIVVVKASSEVNNILNLENVNKQKYRYLSSDECAWLKGFKNYAWVVWSSISDQDFFEWHPHSKREDKLLTITESPSITTVEYLVKRVFNLLEGMNP